MQIKFYGAETDDEFILLYAEKKRENITGIMTVRKVLAKSIHFMEILELFFGLMCISDPWVIQALKP